MVETAKHIVILCSRLDLPGGIERAIVNTANLFTTKGEKVTLLVLDETNKSFYTVSKDVQLIQQPLSFGITPEGNVITRKIKLLSDVLKLRRILKDLQPSLVVATEYPFAAAAILCGAKKYAKVVSWEHHHYYELQRNVFWNKIFKITYPRLDAVVCLNEDEKKLFSTINHKPVIIPNFVIPTTLVSSLTAKTILTVARLTYVKGIDHLLRTAKLVLQQHPDWQWKVIGNGDMQEQVTAFIEKEDLQDRLIIQPPVNNNIQEEYNNASLYVMTSRNECFPMTLLEAMNTGLPCVSFDCETGPRHIINNNDNGFLVEKENPEKLADIINTLIEDSEKIRSMGRSALRSVQQFSPDIIYQQWKEKVFTL